YRRLEARLAEPGAADDFAAYEGQKLEMSFVRRKLDSFEKAFKRMRDFELLDDFPLRLLPDLRQHLTAYSQSQGNFFRFLSGSYRKARWYLRTIVEKKGRKLKEAELTLFRKEIDTLNRLMDHWADVETLAFFHDLPLTDTAEDMLEWHAKKLSRLDLVKAIRATKELPELKPRHNGTDFDAGAWRDSMTTIGQMEAFRERLLALRGHWKSWLHLNQMVRLEAVVVDYDGAHAYANALARSFKSDFQDLKALDDLKGDLSLVEREVLDILAPDLGHLKEAEVVDYLDQVQNSIYMFWIEYLETDHPSLADVSGRRMPRMREEYRTKVRERQEQVVQLILRKLKAEIVDNIEYNRLKNPVTYRDIAHQVGKQRRLWSVRKLVREYWETGLSRLMPCWLASPESVAAIFPMQKDFFDLVIFDEASQCYVERALPVMMRGRHSVIAGDDKQLPPFDLYNVKVDEGEGAFFENEMALEVESVLDLAKNVFPEVQLSWHYRSQEEELINFSNYAFYQGRLNIIPPAHHDPYNVPPLEFIPVEGLWRSNRNEAEAQRVLELVETLVRREDQPTIGIVTFNYFQKELIRDLLERRIEELGQSDDTELLRLLNQAMERLLGVPLMGTACKILLIAWKIISVWWA
ncbi:MAG: AAA domain-containing protein, partial [Bacteroidota bacterium]